MTNALHVELRNVGENLQPGDTIECTVNDTPHTCTFLRYGERQGDLWNRVVWVEIANLREVPGGKLVEDMFDSFRDEFTVNHAPRTNWHRSAGTQYERG